MKHKLRCAVVERDGKQQHCQSLDPKADDFRHSLFSVQRLAQHEQQKQTRRDGDICLVDSQCQHQKRNTDQAAPYFPVPEQVYRKHRQEKGPGIGRGRKHETEVAGKRREAHDQSREHDAQARSADIQGLQHQAGGKRDQCEA